MSLIDEKQNVFTQIGAITSISNDVEVPDPTNSLSSINNNDEIMPFMLDMLTTLKGSEALQETTGEVMTGYIDSVEPTLKTSLKTQYGSFTSDQSLPSTFTSSGFDFNMDQIDPTHKLKNDPSSQVGSLLYADDANGFDKKMYEALNSPGSDITYNNLKFNYDETLDQVNVKPLNPSDTIGDLTDNYIDGLTIIDKKQFTSKTVDLMFGTITTNEDKTLNSIINDEKLNTTIQKIIDGEEDATISEDDLARIQELAKNKLDGLEYYDVGCGEIPNDVTLNSLEELIGNTTGSTDPLTVGNAYLDTLIGGFTGNTENSQLKSDQNLATIKDGFFKKLINAIVNTLVQAITSPPQIRMLYGLYTGFKNDGIPNLGDLVDDLNNNRNLINCLSNSAKETINEFVFNLVKKELINLVIPVSKIILKEKINQYLGILKSLVRFI